MREAYEHRELTKIIWILSEQTPADVMTKENSSVALELLMTKNQLNILEKLWVECDCDYTVLPPRAKASLIELPP